MRSLERLPVAVVVERRPAVSRWLDHIWRPVAVVPGAAAAEPWTVLSQADGVTRYLAGDTDLTAHPAETAPLKDNLEATEPSVYVVLRPSGPPVGWSLLLATVDPTEAHAHSDCGSDLVEAVPMHPAIQLWLSRFVARHHVEPVRIKRKRDRSEKAPDAIRRIRPGDGP